MNITVTYQIDDTECEATVMHGATTKRFATSNVPSLMAKVQNYITSVLETEGINTGLSETISPGTPALATFPETWP